MKSGRGVSGQGGLSQTDGRERELDGPVAFQRVLSDPEDGRSFVYLCESVENKIQLFDFD